MKRQKLVAVIDIGSHSIKMHIGEMIRKHNIREIDYLWVPIAIGKDTFNKGVVSNATILEVIQVLKNFKEVIDSYQIRDFKAIATSSIREASNVDVLIDRISKATGIQIEVIEPIEETAVIYEGIKSVMKDRFGFLQKNVLVFSIGGGSTEIVLQSKGKVLFSETHHQGTLRLIKDFEFQEKWQELNLTSFTVGFSNTIKRFPDIKKIDRFIAINDDMNMLVQKVFKPFLNKEIYCVPRKEFNELYYEIDNLSLSDLKEKYHINESVLKTTKAAFIMVGMFFNLTNSKYILFPNVSTSFFLLYNLSFLEKGLHFVHEDAKDNIISSAIALGKKYQFDESHSLEVSRLSLLLFDELKDTYNLSDRERVYLEAAAIMHDIGNFVSSTSHNKHSAQLILSSQIMGLSKSEMKIIALIARYHRKSVPKPSHTDYFELPTESRLIVSRLSAILRIADAMDNTHNQMIETVKFNNYNDKFEILLKFKDNRSEYLEIVRMAARKKSDLFESFYGLTLKIERLL